MVRIDGPINILVEGTTDEAVAVRLLSHVGLIPGVVFGRKGKDYLLERLPNYNAAARRSPWLVLVDLDRQPCAPALLTTYLSDPAEGMLLRVVVRELESWLLADNTNLACFLSIPIGTIPRTPDAELDPKQTLVNLARKSRKKEIRADIVPRPGSGALVGPGYAGRISQFVTEYWQPDDAAARSDSLRRCLSRLRDWSRSQP